MHDLNYFRDHLGVFAEMAKKRGITLDLDEFRTLDKERRELITFNERRKAQRNKASEEIVRLKKEKKNDASEKQELVAVTRSGDSSRASAASVSASVHRRTSSTSSSCRARATARRRLR